MNSATFATSLKTAPLAQFSPLITIGTILNPNFSKSLNPLGSSNKFMDSNLILFVSRNYFVFKQLEQPGCQ